MSLQTTASLSHYFPPFNRIVTFYFRKYCIDIKKEPIDWLTTHLLYTVLHYDNLLILRDDKKWIFFFTSVMMRNHGNREIVRAAN